MQHEPNNQILSVFAVGDFLRRVFRSKRCGSGISCRHKKGSADAGDVDVACSASET